MALSKHIPKSVCVGVFCALFSAVNAYASVGGSVSADDVNIRAGSSTSSDVVTKANKGQAVTVYVAEGDFYKVSVGGKDNVYVSKQYVDLSGSYGIVSGSSVNVRKTPSMQGDIIGNVNDGHYLSVSSRDGDWYEFVYYGASAYVHKDFIMGDKLSAVQNTTADAQTAQTAQTDAAKTQAQAPPTDNGPLMPDLPLAVSIPAATPEPGHQQPLDQQPANGKPLDQQIPNELTPVGYPVSDGTPPDEQTGGPAPLQNQPPAEQPGMLLPDLPEPDPDRVVEYSVESPAVDLLPSFNEPVNHTGLPVSDAIYAFCKAAPGLNLRAGPSTDTDILIVIDNGEVFEVITEGPEWHQIDFYGQIGFVNAAYVDLYYGEKPERQVQQRQQSGRGDEIISYAKQFLGTPYVYGGNSLSSGVDCSGFVYSVMKNFGIKLNRSASSMVDNGQPVAKGDMQTGDLIFFAANGVNISHVAIYMGGGQYIHSTDSKGKGVSLGDLSDNYSARTYHSSRRVIE